MELWKFLLSRKTLALFPLQPPYLQSDACFLSLYFIYKEGKKNYEFDRVYFHPTENTGRNYFLSHTKLNFKNPLSGYNQKMY